MEAIVIVIGILAFLALSEFNRAERLEDENLKLKEDNGYFKRCAGCSKTFISDNNNPEFYPTCSDDCAEIVQDEVTLKY